MSTFSDIKETLEEIPAIDAHEHICDFRDCNSQTGVVEFVTGGWMGLVMRPISATLTEAEKWAGFLDQWPLIKATAPGSILCRILLTWDIDDRLSESAYEAIAERIGQRSPETARIAFQKAHIRGAIPHYLGHPCCGGLANVGEFFDGTLQFEPGFFPLLGTVPLHQLHSLKDVKALEPLAGMEILSLDHLVEAVSRIISRALEHGVVGLKDHSAYTRGLAFGLPDKRAAETDFASILGGTCLITGNEVFPQTMSLSDYVFDRIVRMSIDHGVPIAMHTGVLAGGRMPDNAHLANFSTVFDRYPEARFEIYHLNYPWIEDFKVLFRKYSNVYANCTWAHVLDPAATERFLFGVLGSFPADRIIAFGGDYLESVERQIACLDLTKSTVAGALASAVTRSQISTATSVEIAKLWFYENPKALYGLDIE
jgi:predicted TIM-barrel fold metal-dependent hydrolase